MAVTEYWKELSTEAVLKGQAVTFTTVYAGLGGASFAVNASDEPLGEISGTGYSRIPIQWTDWTTQMSNTGQLLWSVGGIWPSVGALFVADSSQGGKVIFYDTFTVIPTTSGDTFNVDVGQLILT
jgi:hypothetical protein